MIEQAAQVIENLNSRLKEKDTELTYARTALREALDKRTTFRSPDEVVIYTGNDRAGARVQITMGNAKTTIDRLLQEGGGGDRTKEKKLEQDLAATRRQLTESQTSARGLEERLRRADAAYTAEHRTREELQRTSIDERKTYEANLAAYQKKSERILAGKTADANALQRKLVDLKRGYEEMRDNASRLTTQLAGDLIKNKDRLQTSETKIKTLEKALVTAAQDKQLLATTQANYAFLKTIVDHRKIDEEAIDSIAYETVEQILRNPAVSASYQLIADTAKVLVEILQNNPSYLEQSKSLGTDLKDQKRYDVAEAVGIAMTKAIPTDADAWYFTGDVVWVSPTGSRPDRREWSNKCYARAKEELVKQKSG